MTFRIKGWDKFQHFKDRRPPWIKLYRDILDDPDWHELDGDTAKALVALWLLASEDEEQKGALPDVRRIAFRLRISEKQAKQTLTKLSHWVIQDDINVISSRYQDDAPERAGEETETETYKPEAETEQRASAPRVYPAPPLVKETTWADYVKLRKAKRAPITETALNLIQNEASKAGWTLEQALVECIARGWTSFKAEWVQQNAATPRRTQHQINAEATARALGYGQSNGSFFDVIGECHEVKADVAARLGGSDFQ
jgi:hypothetical protein